MLNLNNLKKVFRKKKPKNKDGVDYPAGIESTVSVPRNGDSATVSAFRDLPDSSYEGGSEGLRRSEREKRANTSGTAHGVGHLLITT